MESIMKTPLDISYKVSFCLATKTCLHSTHRVERCKEKMKSGTTELSELPVRTNTLNRGVESLHSRQYWKDYDRSTIYSQQASSRSLHQGDDKDISSCTKCLYNARYSIR